MKFINQEIKIAIVAILAVVIVYIGIIFLKGMSFSQSNNVYYVEMEDVNGLTPSAEVLANGMNVGMVKDLVFNKETQKVVVSVELSKGFELPNGSVATLTKDMLGAPKVKIVLGKNPADKLAVGDTIQGLPMADLMASAGEMMPKVEVLLPKLDSILTSLNALASDPAMANTLHNMENVSKNLCITTNGINAVLTNDFPKFMKKTNLICEHLEQTTSQLNQVDFLEIANNANSTMNNLNHFTTQLNNKESSLGRLMNDASLYNHMDSTMSNASLLLEDLRLHPKRYVHFSLFGKKDR